MLLTDKQTNNDENITSLAELKTKCHDNTTAQLHVDIPMWRKCRRRTRVSSPSIFEHWAPEQEQLLQLTSRRTPGSPSDGRLSTGRRRVEHGRPGAKSGVGHPPIPTDRPTGGTGRLRTSAERRNVAI